MITFLKITVLFLCAVIAVTISCCSERRKGTCVLLSFFVAAGMTSFFSDTALALSLFTAFCVFAVLTFLTVLLSQKTLHRKNAEDKRKSF